MKPLIIAACLVASLGFPHPVPLFAAEPTLVLMNGKIVSVDEAFSVHEAVAIEGDRILALGSNDEIEALAGAQTARIDLAGRTVIPGLIDNHAHVMRSAAYWPSEVRMDGVTTRAEALARIEKQAAASRPGEWVLTLGGFSPNQFSDDSSPITRQELDRVAPRNPVLMQHLFGMAFANTEAFRAIDLDEDARPTGTVRGAAMRRMLDVLAEPGKKEHARRASDLNRYLNSLGLTAVLDATGGEPGNPDFDAYQALDDAQVLTLRVFHLYPAPDYQGEQVHLFAALLDELPVFEDSDFFQRVGVGERLYGPIHDSMIQPAADSEAHRRAFASLARQTAEAGLHLHQHATHIQSINQHLDTFEVLAADHDLAALRWTFAHADGIDEQALARSRQLGLMVATQSRRLISGSFIDHPLPLISFGDPPLRDMRESNVRFGLGTDALVVAQANPFWTLWWAVTGKAMNGEQLTDQTLSRQDALIAHTRDNAWFVFREDDLGSLEPGKFADMLVLDRDYLEVPADEIRLIKPDLTIVGGKVVFERS